MSMNTRIPNRPDDEIDRLFTAYFQAERPARWPGCPRPWADKAQPVPASQADATARSRWALAASVALLIGSCWYLSGHMTDGKSKPGWDLKGGEANKKHLDDLGKAPPKMP
jgi:hypothetical protein